MASRRLTKVKVPQQRTTKPVTTYSTTPTPDQQDRANAHDFYRTKRNIQGKVERDQLRKGKKKRRTTIGYPDDPGYTSNQPDDGYRA